jgi:hypothetical protein
MEGDYKPDFRVGERLRLLVREPLGRKDARITHPGNYVPVAYVGEVEETAFQARVPQMRVRWHLPVVWIRHRQGNRLHADPCGQWRVVGDTAFPAQCGGNYRTHS